MMLPLVHGEAISIRADNDAGVNDTSPTNAGALVDHCSGIDDRIIPNSGAGFDRDILKNYHVVSENNVLSNRCELTDRNIPSQLGSCGN